MKRARSFSSDDDSEIEECDNEDEVKLVACEKPPVFVFTYNETDASEDHNRIGILVALPKGFHGLNYALLPGGMKMKIGYKWPLTLTSEAIILW